MTGQLETISMSAVETVLNKTFKQAVGVIQIVQENVKGTPPSPSSTEEYIAFTVNYGATEKLTKSIYRRVGIATAQIFTPLGVGTGRAIVISELVIAGFQGVEFVGRCLTVEDVSANKIGPRGSFYQMNVDIAFQYNETK